MTIASGSRWREFFAAAAWPLPTWLLLCCVLRLPAVLFADGFDFPDQQFQYVEPAWHLASGEPTHTTWELRNGLRSDVYPRALAAVFHGLRDLGFDDPMATMRAVRGVHALLSLLPMALFWFVVVRWRPLARPRVPMLLFAMSGLMVTGVQPSGPACAATLAVTAALALVGPSVAVAFGGLCLGLAFCGRFQDALFGPAFVVVLLGQRRAAAAAWFVLGCVPGVCLQGFFDLARHGQFLATPWHYVSANVSSGAAELWRAQPAWFYWLAGVVPVLAFVPPWLGPAWRRVVAGARVLPFAAAGALFHVAVHSCLARKALRFEHGAFMMLLAVAAIGLPAAAGRLARWHTGALFVVHGGFWLVSSFWFGNAGAVRLANWLREQPDFTGHVLVVDGDATALGGFFYSRPEAHAVVGCSRAELDRHLAPRHAAPAPLVVVVREPLAPEVAGAAELALVAAFPGQWDLRTGERRYVYRRRSRRARRRLGVTCRRPSSARPS